MEQLKTNKLENGVLHVQLAGRLDLENLLKLENPFTFAVSTQKAPVVVDLSAVDFVASMALRLLLRNSQAQQARGGRMVIYNPKPTVRQVLAVSGIDQAVAIHDSFEAACQDAIGI